MRSLFTKAASWAVEEVALVDAGAASFMNQGLRIEGSIRGAAELHIHCDVIGDVAVERLFVAESGAVEGRVSAERAEISGRIAGPIDARRIILKSTARVTGDLTYEDLEIEPGARLDGAARRRPAAECGGLPAAVDDPSPERSAA